MMGRMEFAEEVLENMKKHLENGVEANVCTMLTTNDVKTIGLFIRNADQHVSIQVAMEGLYQRYLDYYGEVDLDDIAHQFAAAFREKAKENGDLVEQSFQNLMDFSQAKGKIHLKLINSEWSSELLKTTPHIPYLDLSAVFYLFSPAGELLIHEDLMNMWNITPHDLYKIALDNMVKQNPVKFFSVKNFLEDQGALLPEERHNFEEERDFLYALTNTKQWNGASVLLYPSILEAYMQINMIAIGW